MHICHRLVLLMPLLAIVAGCSDDRPVLHIYNWGDYISEEVVEKFEEANNCKVEIDAFDSNEAMYTKLKQGAGGYDIIVPSSYMAKLMYNQAMILPLDHTKLPAVKRHFDETYATLSLDSDMTYSVPYFVSVSGIGYDSRRLNNFKPTWTMFDRADLKDACSLLNDHRETMGAALISLGYTPNTTNQTEIQHAVKRLLGWKQNIAKFEVDAAKQSLASGEFKMIHTYNGDMLHVSAEKPYIKFVIPQEGSTITFDNFVIPTGCDNLELAYKFINFMYEPENAAENMNHVMYVMPNKTAISLVDESLRNNPAFAIPTEDLKRCQPLEDLGDANRFYTDAWDRVRN
ncbi:MAG: spermidine/putrescine ABC transporter substrate-binding protein [bacterium]|nr:spermidine/putrescine ABC transporter substrate-binding protein [bacterium]